MQSAESLVRHFLNGREIANISVKQTNWLVDQLKHERKEVARYRRYFVGGYEINIYPNGAALIKPCGGAKSGTDFEKQADNEHAERISKQKRDASFRKMRDRVHELRAIGKLEEANQIQDEWETENFQ